jgi:hypothetical protein
VVPRAACDDALHTQTVHVHVHVHVQAWVKQDTRRPMGGARCSCPVCLSFCFASSSILYCTLPRLSLSSLHTCAPATDAHNLHTSSILDLHPFCLSSATTSVTPRSYPRHAHAHASKCVVACHLTVNRFQPPSAHTPSYAIITSRLPRMRKQRQRGRRRQRVGRR